MEQPEEVALDKPVQTNKFKKVQNDSSTGPSECSPAAECSAVEGAASFAKSTSATKHFKGKPEELVANELRNYSKRGGVETAEGGLTESPAKKKLRRNVTSNTELSSSGVKLIDKIIAHMEMNGFLEQLEAQLVAKASEIDQTKDFFECLRDQNVLEETEGQLVQDGQIEEVIKDTCRKRALGSLILALQRSKNDGIVLDLYIWLEKNSRAVKSLATKQRLNATGIFVAGAVGLILLDLQTFQTTAVTNEPVSAVAVSHKLQKVYWSQDLGKSSIWRSNFDGSVKEIIVSNTGDNIFTLAIDEATENLYFALQTSHKIKVYNALGKNCAAVITNTSLVNNPVSIALDSANGYMYWCNISESDSNSLVCANQDGSNAAIISSGFTDLSGISLDEASNSVLYWADGQEKTIGTIHVSGRCKKTLVKLESLKDDAGPSSVQVDGQKIYFLNWDADNNVIQSVNRDSGKDVTTIFNSGSNFISNIALLCAPVKQF